VNLSDGYIYRAESDVHIHTYIPTWLVGVRFVLCLYIYMNLFHSIQLTPQKLCAEPGNSASAEALLVARRQKEASRDKTREQALVLL